MAGLAGQVLKESAADGPESRALQKRIALALDMSEAEASRQCRGHRRVQRHLAEVEKATRAGKMRGADLCVLAMATYLRAAREELAEMDDAALEASFNAAILHEEERESITNVLETCVALSGAGIYSDDLIVMALRIIQEWGAQGDVLAHILEIEWRKVMRGAS